MVSNLNAAQKMLNHLSLNSLIILVSIFLLLCLLPSKLFFLKQSESSLQIYIQPYHFTAHNPLIAFHCTVNKSQTHPMPGRSGMFCLSSPSLAALQSILLASSSNHNSPLEFLTHARFAFPSCYGMNVCIPPQTYTLKPYPSVWFY